MFTRGAVFLAIATAVNGLPSTVPLTFNEGYWQGNFTVGAQNFSLAVDTGSFAIIVKEGLYKPGPASQQTNVSEFIQFWGAGKDGTLPAAEIVFFVRDDVSFADVTVHDFLAGNITSGDNNLPADGVAGFSPPASFNDDLSNGQGLVETFCEQGDLTPCQFGIALGKDGHGSLIFGEIDQSKIAGDITVLPTTTNDTWTVRNATAAEAPNLVIDDTPFSPIFATIDSGSPNIVGSLQQVRDIFNLVGYNITEQTNDGVTVAIGTYDCARTPARVGFSFPPSTKVHYIDPAANELNRTADGRLCTANIVGTSAVDTPRWSVGQSWFRGRYLQHDLDNNTLSFVDLA